jgi:hypothetical protein
MLSRSAIHEHERRIDMRPLGTVSQRETVLASAAKNSDRLSATLFSQGMTG